MMGSGLNTAFGKFVVLVVLAIFAVAVAAWSYRQWTESNATVRTMEQVDETIENTGNAVVSLIDSLATPAQSPDSKKTVPKPLTEYNDAERNALWWRIAVECRTDNDGPQYQHSIDTYKVRPLADELQIPFGDLLSFWRSGETAAWRTLENPANSVKQTESKDK